MGGTVGRGGAEPLVSVIMPARNEEKNIGVAIDSIRNQSYKNWELVVVDDYSTDNTGAVVQSFGDRRITLITKTHELPGEATARNVATEFAGGEYITYQDADDSSNERRIERQLACALENPGHLAVGCWIQTELAGQARVVRLPLDHQRVIAGSREGIGEPGKEPLAVMQYRRNLAVH